MDAATLNMDKILSFAAKLMGVSLTYFLPIRELAYALLALFLIDWVTGVWKSRVVRRRITSYRLRKSSQKIGSYMVALISAHILNESILGGVMHLPQLIAGYIGVTEVASILENLSEITGRDLMLEIANKVKDSFKNKYLK